MAHSHSAFHSCLIGDFAENQAGEPGIKDFLCLQILVSATSWSHPQIPFVAKWFGKVREALPALGCK